MTTAKAGKATAPRSFTEIARSEEALAAQTRALEAALQVRVFSAAAYSYFPSESSSHMGGACGGVAVRTLVAGGAGGGGGAG